MIYKQIYERRLKPPKKFMNWVKTYFPIYEFKSKGELFISSDRKGKKKTRQLRSNTNFLRLSEHEYFTIILTTSKRIEQHIYKVYFSINKETLKEEFHIKLHSLMKLENNIETGIHRISDGEIEIYRKGFRNISYGGFRYQDDGVVYPNVNTIFAKSELKHVQNIVELAEPQYYTTRLNQQLSRIYKYRLGIESVQRLGGHQLAKEIASEMSHADMRIINRNFIIRNREHIKNNATYQTILFYEELRKQGIPESNRYVQLLNLDMLKRLKIHKEQHSKTRLFNYLLRQKQDYNYYKDYINMLNQLGTPAEDRIVFYPKNLTEAHDELVQRVNIINVERDLKSKPELELKAISVHDDLIKLEYTGDKYAIIAPKGLKDIMLEGKNLNHCVGSSRFLEGHSNKDFAIMFLRDKENADKSLITFTYHYDGRVTSIHGYGNNKSLEYLEEAKDFIKNDWLNFVKTTRTVSCKTRNF